MSSILIELAARLGDDAAGLTQSHIDHNGPHYFDAGYRFGRFIGLFSGPWMELQRKEEPNADRILQTFFLLETLEKGLFKFDLNWLVQHLCTPPYDVRGKWTSKEGFSSSTEGRVLEESAKPKSCRTVIDELYAHEDLPELMLEFMNQFSQTATELDVYD